MFPLEFISYGYLDKKNDLSYELMSKLRISNFTLFIQIKETFNFEFY